MLVLPAAGVHADSRLVCTCGCAGSPCSAVKHLQYMLLNCKPVAAGIRHAMHFSTCSSCTDGSTASCRANPEAQAWHAEMPAPCPAANNIIWRRELSATETYIGLAVDPLDCRRLCLCGSQGALVVLRFLNIDKDDVDLRQYRVGVPGGGQGSSGGGLLSLLRGERWWLLPSLPSVTMSGVDCLLWGLP
jgi:hypothetical protein